MRLETKIFPADALQEQAADWDRLNEGADHSYLLSSQFNLALLQHFGHDGVKLLRTERGGELVAMALLEPEGKGRWRCFQPSQQPLGPVVMWVGLDTNELIGSFAAALPRPVLLLALSQQDPRILSRPATAGRIDTLDYIQTARIEVTGSFDDYWAARGKRLRQNQRWQRNRLAREGVQTSLQTLTDAEQMRAAVTRFGELECAGWKAGAGTAVSIDNDQGRFYQQVMEQACAKGQGIVFEYYYDERLVAIDLCVRSADTVINLKTTYVENIKNASPAMHLREEYIRALFEQPDVRWLEFYGKCMDWHTKLTDDIRRMYHLNWYAHSLLRQARQALAEVDVAAIKGHLQTPQQIPAEMVKLVRSRG